MCMGYLMWSPQEFWRSNVWEITNAMRGLAYSKGAKKHKTQSEIDLDRITEKLKKQQEIERRRDDRLKRASRQD